MRDAQVNQKFSWRMPKPKKKKKKKKYKSVEIFFSILRNYFCVVERKKYKPEISDPQY